MPYNHSANSRKGTRRQSSHWTRFERPAGEPSLAVGISAIALVIAAFATLSIMFGG